MQLHLLYFYYQKETPNVSTSASDLPQVTIQLPIYNEKYVAERLIESVIKIEYPNQKVEIQILDDSTDETTDIIAKLVQTHQAQGYDIKHIRRKERTGFKAGALVEGLKKASGEFIAIFDADFLPKPDFLLRTIPQFINENIGVVQTRWQHLNEPYSLLTRLQAFQLNAHFIVEQSGRESGNLMLQFNGTAGVWRRATIEDAGGWQPDTLTEDLDLSYRAQLRGWQIRYLEDVGSPAELPIEMNSLKSQQYRWMKGGAETALKILPKIWGTSLPTIKKLHATGHLLSSAIFVFVFIAALSSVPTLYMVVQLDWKGTYFSVFLFGLLAIAAVYFQANVLALNRELSLLKRLLKFIILFPVFLALSMGLSLHNTIAVVHGWIGKKSPFVRTPKLNIRRLSDSAQDKKYIQRHWSWTVFAEGLLTLYFLFAVYYAMDSGNSVFLYYHVLLAVGFGAIFFYSVSHLSTK